MLVWVTWQPGMAERLGRSILAIIRNDAAIWLLCVDSMQKFEGHHDTDAVDVMVI